MSEDVRNGASRSKSAGLHEASVRAIHGKRNHGSEYVEKQRGEAMKGILKGLLSVLVLSTLNPSATLAQANNGAGEGKPEVHVDYYKLPPGRQDEWLALYKKYHYPIVRYMIDHGQMTSETIYTRAIHELSPSWDIAIVIVIPPPSQKKKAEFTRAQLIRKLYPDLDDYVQGERKRWALTLEQWNESWVEIDIEKNPSLYYPKPD
jgi:hypothetical protein